MLLGSFCNRDVPIPQPTLRARTNTEQAPRLPGTQTMQRQERARARQPDMQKYQELQLDAPCSSPPPPGTEIDAPNPRGFLYAAKFL